MDTTLGTCRDLQWRDKAAFVALMNQAFTPDPLFQRLFVVGQTEAEASRRSRAFLAFLFDQAYLLGHRLRGLFDGDRLLACYLLEAPGRHWLRRLLGGACLLFKSLGLPWQVSFAAFGLMNAYMRATRRAAPAVPHYYLRMIGVHGSVRGTGLGGYLLREIIAQAEADERVQGLALDTENPGNLPLYYRYDFLLGAVQDLRGLPLYCLFRPNRQLGTPSTQIQ
ncbi:GNAT family N-acetyltransferase [Chitinimonas sp. JJ19]|uniref:GNAT family N-acetyltransferase n=1 Tax=Chitinimonas sp. JJ19 TaxID=3109352 RepID=UPI001A62B74A|nr:GNAT family N-acetyltransferase [Chitinimonas sp.]